MAEQITVSSVVAAPIEKVWEFFTEPKHVMQWNHASDDWHSPRAVNYLKVGGVFNYRMEARDGSAGFDFTGTYNEVVRHERIVYTMDDGRKVEETFVSEGAGTKVAVMFDPETINPPSMQRAGWQAILNNFKSYTEKQA